MPFSTHPDIQALMELLRPVPVRPQGNAGVYLTC